MATGVVGASGGSAQKTVALVIKHATGSATTRHLPMAGKIALTVIQVIQNL